MLSDPVQRAAMARRNVKESKLDDEDNPLKQWENTRLGSGGGPGKRVDLRLSLEDPHLLIRHLQMIRADVDSILVAAVKLDGLDRKLLVRSRIRQLALKLSAKRWDQ